MNTKVVKSFGLALLLAVGILALTLALGTFNAGKARAQEVNTVTVQPDTAAADTGTPLTVGFMVTSGALTAGQEIAITLPDFALPGTINPSTVTIRFGDAAGHAANVAVSGQTVTVEVGNDTSGVPMFILGVAEAQVYVTFTRAAGIATGTTAKVSYVQVNGVGPSTADGGNEFTITPSVTLSHSAGFNDTELVVTGASFPSGTVNIFVTNADDTSIAGGTTTTSFGGSTYRFLAARSLKPL